MSVELTICRADELLFLTDRYGPALPYDAVISLEHVRSKGRTAEEGRAPRLAKEISTEWKEKQIILTCWDVENEKYDAPVPHQRVIVRAMDFVHRKMPADRPLKLLIHCRSGRSRSTAMGLVMLAHLNKLTPQQAIDKLLEIRHIAAPNIVIVQHGDDFLGYGGTLVEAVKANPLITERRIYLEKCRERQAESFRAANAPNA